MFNNVFFQYQVLSRMLKLLPRKSKRVRLLYFQHALSSDEKFVTVKYRFSNAVYYKIGAVSLTSRSIRIGVTDAEQKISMTVYGFLRKAEYILTVKKDDVYLTRVAQHKTNTDRHEDNYPQILLPA